MSMPDYDSFRAGARAFIAANEAEFGVDAQAGLDPQERLALGRRWQRLKHDNGYVGIAWPKEYGGAGLTNIHKIVYEQEQMPYGMPDDYFTISLGMPVPIMLRRAPEEQRQRFALPALRGEEIWCQLFSEPAAGSDLAGLRTRAEPDGNDGWRVNGQKLWTSQAQYCDYGVIVVRTDPSVPKHRGLTYFWVDMKSPGITVRPVKLMTGDSHVNEVFFDNVRVPDSQRLGAVGEGFAVAMETLSATPPPTNPASGRPPPISRATRARP